MKRNTQNKTERSGADGTGSTQSRPSPARAGKSVASVSPRSLLLPYQERWVDDESRFKFGLWSRQTGKDFSTGYEIAQDCLRNAKTTWLIGAAGERQALESLSKVKEWAEAFAFAIAEYAEDRSGPDGRSSAEALIKSGTITWSNGSRVIAIPANPNTVRGYSANVVMTEFAFLEDPDATWRAILPSITNPLRGGLKKVRIITTPNGVGNKCHELWQKENRWSKHKVTIHDAVRDGLPINVEELREAIADPEGWAQEFECEFLDVSSVLLPYELIAQCESIEATKAMTPDFFLQKGTKGTKTVLGIDFGRKKDLTVGWTLEQLGDVLHTREVLELAKMSTPDQVNALRPRIQRAARVCLDYTGPGIGLGDYLVKEFGEWKPDGHKFGKVELCNFSNTLKQEIFSKLRMAFENRGVRVPVDRAVREDLHSIHRVTTATGQISYKAPHTEDGHADRCTALALAVRAGAVQAGAVFKPQRVVARRGERSVTA